jgi:multiple sugar transport system permease protein
MVATVFSIIGSFQLFTEPSVLYFLNKDVIGSAYTPNWYAYSLSFNGQEYNYSATIAILMGLLTVIVAYVVQRIGQRKGA